MTNVEGDSCRPIDTASFRFTPKTLGMIRRHAELRRSAATIAALMKCSADTVENICRKHGIELVTIPDGLPTPAPYRTSDGSKPLFLPVDIHVGSEALERIQREARRRGLRASTLIERIAERVAMDGLFTAVLDR